MPKYRLLAPHFLDGHYRERGDIVECEKPSRRMEPLEKPKKEPEVSDVTADEIAAVVAAIKAEPGEGELTEKGNPTKAAVEARVGKSVPQALFLAAIK